MASTDPIKLSDQPSDPALFAPLSLDENRILNAHLTSGWYKQSAVYPQLSEPWQETSGLLHDLVGAWDAAFEARAAAREAKPAARVQLELAEPEPEAGT